MLNLLGCEGFAESNFVFLLEERLGCWGGKERVVVSYTLEVLGREGWRQAVCCGIAGVDQG